MKVLKNNYNVGNRVLFLWEQHPYTGTINSINTTSYGIVPDASYYETDINRIPRLNEEVFIPKSLCKHTGEIFIDYRNDSPYRTRYQYLFGDDIRKAYEILPKRSIYPVVVWDTPKQFIEFIPDKMFFKTKDNRIFFYHLLHPLMPQLVTRDGIIAKPSWIHQLPHKCGSIGYDNISEDDIEKVWEINDYVYGVNPWDAFSCNHVDIVYDINSVTLTVNDTGFKRAVTKYLTIRENIFEDVGIDENCIPFRFKNNKDNP